MPRLNQKEIAYGFPVPINDKKIIEVTSSAFGDVKAVFN